MAADNGMQCTALRVATDAGTRMSFKIPWVWTRRGLVLERQKDEHVSSVSGDPCIVWDEAINGWRMVFFYSPPGHG